jgi:hypothetical protein
VPLTPPKIVGHGAEQMRLVCFAHLPPDERRVVMGTSFAGPGPREITGVAVCEGDGGFYVFSCDAAWNVMFDSWCQTLKDATEGLYDWVYVK